MVYVRVADTSDATLGELRAAGVAPTHVSDRYRVVTGFVMPLSLSRVASLTAVRSVSRRSGRRPPAPERRPRARRRSRARS